MLQTKHLISPIFSLDALLIAGADKTLDIYLHDVNGYIDVAKGTPFLKESVHSVFLTLF